MRSQPRNYRVCFLVVVNELEEQTTQLTKAALSATSLDSAVTALSSVDFVLPRGRDAAANDANNANVSALGVILG